MGTRDKEAQELAKAVCSMSGSEKTALYAFLAGLSVGRQEQQDEEKGHDREKAG